MNESVPTTGARQEGGAAGPVPGAPWFSVIIPVYEHWHLIPGLLERLAAQTIGAQDFEVLIVDNGSRHMAPPAPMPANVRLLRCDTPGSYAARNVGVAEARGRYLVFTDADCLPAPDWLAALRRAAEAASRPTLLAGAVEMLPPEPRPSAYGMYDLVKGIPQDWYVSRGYATTANLAVPAAVFTNVGTFDAARYSGGDAAFCRRAVAAGFGLEYVAGAVVQHPARDCWQTLSTKVRRIKGGQLTAGTPRQRVLWWLRTFTPPVIAFWRFLVISHQPVRYRLVAVAIQMRIWMLEMREALRCLGAANAERR